MKTRNIILGLSLFVSTWLAACSDDDSNTIKQTSTTLNFTLPENLTNVQISGIIITTENIATKKKTVVATWETLDNQPAILINEGFYNLSLEGKISYTLDGNTINGKIQGYKESVQVTGETVSIPLTLYLQTENGGFVIAEIFFAGTANPQGAQYGKDEYIRIFNNSDSVLYADGLFIAESKLNTTRKDLDYTPDIMAEAIAIKAIYQIPGNGKDYPVQPGESLVICDQAIDHTASNSNSFDLRKADFEWYDESTNNTKDIDNPEVTNLDKIYCYTLSVWSPSNQGNTTIIIGKLGVGKEAYLNDYTYDYDYNIAGNNGVIPGKTQHCYKIPYEWIIDAVNLSPSDQKVWLLTTPVQDQGFTFVAPMGSSKERYGKSVRRKNLSTGANGRPILKDTNNSSVDFEIVSPDPFSAF